MRKKETKERYKQIAKNTMLQGAAAANRLQISADNAADSYARSMRNAVEAHPAKRRSRRQGHDRSALRQEQSFNNWHNALIGSSPSGRYIVARMEPTARAKRVDVHARHTAIRLGYDGGITSSSIRIGNRRRRTPVACQTAFATAPAEPVTPISPTPLMPSALTCGSCSSIMSASRLGTSAFTGTWYSARFALMIRPER